MGTQGAFLGSRSSYIPDPDTLIPSDSTPLPPGSLSLKHNNVPGILVLIAVIFSGRRPGLQIGDLIPPARPGLLLGLQTS